MLIPDVSDPIALFDTWLREARQAGVPLPESMALATIAPGGQPSVRMVLLKHADSDGFVFYTNINSRKAADLKANPRAALCFHWPELGRQVRVEGSVTPVSGAEADAYFATRPRESQLGAWASPQSSVLSSREELELRFSRAGLEYQGRDVPRPPFWSGCRLRPAQIEFWKELPNRLHDRVLYIRALAGGWAAQRLYP
ncbi:MAG TPA: pyridoxamine 5'-phosphate oxidase [Candidatus Hydrogenedentes bacterium]|nr:pyridoxamine 5'-phosphate oxidase [Candidatus Hydrogenedentota bacterium]